MKRRLLSLAVIAAGLVGIQTVDAQVNIAQAGKASIITFNGYTGSGFDQAATIGHLDSDTWSVRGLNNGTEDVAYGGNFNTGNLGYSRGVYTFVGNGAAETAIAIPSQGGVYAGHKTNGGNDTVMMLVPQVVAGTPAIKFFRSGDAQFRITNNTNKVIQRLDLDFILGVLARTATVTQEATDVSITVAYSLSQSAPFAFVDQIEYQSFVEDNNTAGGYSENGKFVRMVGTNGLNLAPGQFVTLRFTVDALTDPGNVTSAFDIVALDDISVTLYEQVNVVEFSQTPTVNINAVTVAPIPVSTTLKYYTSETATNSTFPILINRGLATFAGCNVTVEMVAQQPGENAAMPSATLVDGSGDFNLGGILANQTALATPISVVYGNNVLTQSFTFDPIDDVSAATKKHQGDRTRKFKITSADGTCVVGSRNQIEVIIVEEDPVFVSFDGTFVYSENTAAATLNVKLKSDIEAKMQVPVVVGDNSTLNTSVAIEGQDYSLPTNQQVGFLLNGVKDAKITALSITEDMLVEADENFQVKVVAANVALTTVNTLAKPHVGAFGLIEVLGDASAVSVSAGTRTRVIVGTTIAAIVAELVANLAGAEITAFDLGNGFVGVYSNINTNTHFTTGGNAAKNNQLRLHGVIGNGAAAITSALVFERPQFVTITDNDVAQLAFSSTKINLQEKDTVDVNKAMHYVDYDLTVSTDKKFQGNVALTVVSDAFNVVTGVASAVPVTNATAGNKEAAYGNGLDNIDFTNDEPDFAIFSSANSFVANVANALALSGFTGGAGNATGATVSGGAVVFPFRWADGSITKTFRVRVYHDNLIEGSEVFKLNILATSIANMANKDLATFNNTALGVVGSIATDVKIPTSSTEVTILDDDYLNLGFNVTTDVDKEEIFSNKTEVVPFKTVFNVDGQTTPEADKFPVVSPTNAFYTGTHDNKNFFPTLAKKVTISAPTGTAINGRDYVTNILNAGTADLTVANNANLVGDRITLNTTVLTFGTDIAIGTTAVITAENMRKAINAVSDFGATVNNNVVTVYTHKTPTAFTHTEVGAAGVTFATPATNAVSGVVTVTVGNNAPNQTAISFPTQAGPIAIQQFNNTNWVDATGGLTPAAFAAAVNANINLTATVNGTAVTITYNGTAGAPVLTNAGSLAITTAFAFTAVKTIVLNEVISGGVRVNSTTSDETINDDYNFTAAAEYSDGFQFFVVDDKIAEQTETAVFNLVTADTRVKLIDANKTLTVTIQDEDAMFINVNATAVKDTTVEGDSLKIVLKASKAPVADVTVGFKLVVANSSAVDADFLAYPTHVFTPTGSLTKEIWIKTNDDNIIEAMDSAKIEAYVVTGFGAQMEINNTFTTRIKDNDFVKLGFSAATASALEGDAGQNDQGFTVVYDANGKTNLPSANVTVTVVGGTATLGLDYEFNTDNFVINPNGQLNVARNFNIKPDVMIEDNETIKFVLTSSNTNVQFVNDTLVYTITNDDVATVEFDSFGASVNETNADQTITFNVVSSAPVTGSVEIAVSANGTATQVTDFTVNFANNDKVEFFQNPGIVSKSYSIVVKGDAISEATETVVITLSQPTNGVVLGSKSTYTLVIKDDENPVTEGTIAEALANPGASYLVTAGVQSMNYGATSGDVFAAVSDASGSVFLDIDGKSVATGAEVLAQGSVVSVNGLNVFKATTMLIAGNVTPAAATSTTAAFTASEVATQKALACVSVVDAAAWAVTTNSSNNHGSFAVTSVTDGTNTWSVRIDDDSPLFGTAAPVGTFDVDGFVSTETGAGLFLITGSAVTLKANAAFTSAPVANDLTGNWTFSAAQAGATYAWNIDGSAYTTQVAAHKFQAIGTYTATLTVTVNGCSHTTTEQITVTDAIGINEITNVVTSIYPNPTNGVVTIAANVEINNVVIVNALGAIVTEITVNANEVNVDLNNVANGVYFVNVYANGEVIAKRIIKQ
jgi:hypothetical protein